MQNPIDQGAVIERSIRILEDYYIESFYPKRAETIFTLGALLLLRSTSVMNIALFFTFSRILSAPVFAVFFISGYRQQNTTSILIALLCAVLIELSDMFDGMIARARKEVTDFGKVSDPVADSLSRLTVFTSFLVTGIIPLWMYLVFLYRDSLIQLLRIVCATTGLVLAARSSGKIKAIFQAAASFIVIVSTLAHVHGVTWFSTPAGEKGPAYWAVFIAAIVTAISFFDYTFSNWSSIQKLLKRK